MYPLFKIRYGPIGLFLVLFTVAKTLFAQDSTNIIDYSDQLLIRVYTVTKSNSLAIENQQANKTLKLLPNGNTSLGLGFNYKKFGLGVAFGLPPSEERDQKYGRTQRLDLQGSLYGKKIGADGFFQVYKGYYNENPQDFLDWNSDLQPQIESMRILSVGATAFYVFNSDTYSYRAAFVRDEIQRRSSGSFLLGLFGNYDEGSTEKGFIPEEFPDSLRTLIDVKEFKNLAVGVSLGYAHNFVIDEKFILGIAILPGFGYQRVTIRELDGTLSSEDQPAGQLLGRIALGYEHRHFFLGLTGSVNVRSIDLDPYNFNLATEQFRFIIGKRFKM
jgi:hypothetical protein